MSTSSPGHLWQQAGGDPEKYRRLMIEHGHLLRPGDPGYDKASRVLPCGWQPGKPRAEQDRCEVTDLLRASCAHCTGRTGDEGKPEVSELDPHRFGPWFQARYDGECDGCGYEFQGGDSIRSDGAGGWLCGECGMARS